MATAKVSKSVVEIQLSLSVEEARALRRYLGERVGAPHPSDTYPIYHVLDLLPVLDSEV